MLAGARLRERSRRARLDAALEVLPHARRARRLEPPDGRVGGVPVALDPPALADARRQVAEVPPPRHRHGARLGPAARQRESRHLGHTQQGQRDERGGEAEERVALDHGPQAVAHRDGGRRGGQRAGADPRPRLGHHQHRPVDDAGPPAQVEVDGLVVVVGVEALQLGEQRRPHEQARDRDEEDLARAVVLAGVDLAWVDGGEGDGKAVGRKAHLDQHRWVVDVNQLGPGHARPGRFGGVDQQCDAVGLEDGAGGHEEAPVAAETGVGEHGVGRLRQPPRAGEVDDGGAVAAGGGSGIDLGGPGVDHDHRELRPGLAGERGQGLFQVLAAGHDDGENAGLGRRRHGLGGRHRGRRYHRSFR